MEAKTFIHSNVRLKYATSVGEECTKKLSYHFLHHIKLNLKLIKVKNTFDEINPIRSEIFQTANDPEGGL